MADLNYLDVLANDTVPVTVTDKAAQARANADDPKVIAAQWWNKISIAQSRVAKLRKEYVAASEMLAALEAKLDESKAEMTLSGELSDKTKYRNAEEREAAILLAMKPQRTIVAKASADARAKQAALESAREEFEAIKWTMPLIAQTLAR